MEIYLHAIPNKVLFQLDFHFTQEFNLNSLLGRAPSFGKECEFYLLCTSRFHPLSVKEIMKKTSFFESFLLSLTAFFTEFFSALRSLKSNFFHAFSPQSKLPIIRMFHEALKSEYKK